MLVALIQSNRSHFYIFTNEPTESLNINDLPLEALSEIHIIKTYMYYEFLVTHLDAPFLLLSAVTTGLIIRIFYNAYMKLKLAMRVLTSVILFIINAIMIVPGVVFLYRWIMLCGFYQPSGAFNYSNGCSGDVFSLLAPGLILLS